MVQETSPIRFKEYVAIRNDFILKKDEDQIILYPLDFIESKFITINPFYGFVLSLLDGTRKFSDVKADFNQYFPNCEQDLEDLLTSLDTTIRKYPTQSGIGKDGLYLMSDEPITQSCSYDPREFIVSADKFRDRSLDIRNKKRLKTPICLMAFFTDQCQTNCIYCYAHRKREPEMSLENWKKIIQQMKALDIKLISLDGGDVIARKDGIDFLEELVKNDILFLLSTKGHFTKEHVRRLMDAGFKNKVRYVGERKVQLSVDAWDDEKVKVITGNPNFKKNITETFDNFMEVGISPKVKGVLMPYNVDQMYKIVEFFYARGARRFQFVKYARSFFRHKDEYFMNEEAINEAKIQLEKIHSQFPDIDISDDLNQMDLGGNWSLDLKKQVWTNRSGCGGGWTMLGIAPNGRAILCEQMKQEESYYVGDLNRQTIMEVWNGKEMLDFIYPPRDKFKNTICETCDEFEPCHWEKGYCYRNAFFSYGTVYDAPPNCYKQMKLGLRLN
ncbi:radical SAM protein [Lacrimispora xylanolytica]|uniref:radical SAM/SPASM domain-containing protein n=1 Tax=Clostridium sp. 12(A) TaxID=1163671 RepID=UPI0004660F6B|nr:radical SAM/SPASM domain-containing protein [Clostridium sp. 12(A)]